MFRQLSILFIAAGLLVASCAKENDPGVTDDRDAFTGTWNCKETENASPPVTVTFQISVSKAGVSDTVNIDNFNNIGTGFKAFALVSGTSVVIPVQSVGGFNVNPAGSGYLSSGKISLTYKVDNISYTAECSR